MREILTLTCPEGQQFHAVLTDGHCEATPEMPVVLIENEVYNPENLILRGFTGFPDALVRGFQARTRAYICFR